MYIWRKNALEKTHMASNMCWKRPILVLFWLWNSISYHRHDYFVATKPCTLQFTGKFNILLKILFLPYFLTLKSSQTILTPKAWPYRDQKKKKILLKFVWGRVMQHSGLSCQSGCWYITCISAPGSSIGYSRFLSIFLWTQMGEQMKAKDTGSCRTRKRGGGVPGSWL